MNMTGADEEDDEADAAANVDADEADNANNGDDGAGFWCGVGDGDCAPAH